MPNYPKITSKILDYDSPSGKVRIGKYIPPFENVKDGFGFMGVIVEDFVSGKLQCHLCGKWFETLPNHLRKHEITGKDYKIRFGLLQSTALKSKKMRLKQSKIMQRLRKKNPQNNYKFTKNNSFAGNRKGIKKAVESKNKYGVCDLQIIERIINLKDELGKTPTLTQLSDRYGGAMIFHLSKRYGSYIKLCHDIGLTPNFSNFYPKYSKQYFIEKALNGEPTVRNFTVTESRNLYKYFKGGFRELKEIVNRIKGETK
jgi:hypothetical protein